MPIDCTNKQLSIIDILQSLLTTDTNGNCGIRLIPVADGNADFPDCDFKHLDDLAILQLLIDVDGNGNLGLRVIETTEVVAGTNCVDCDNKHLPVDEQIKRRVIGLSADGNPALRLAKP